jgi:hypothetical protein
MVSRFGLNCVTVDVEDEIKQLHAVSEKQDHLLVVCQCASLVMAVAYIVWIDQCCFCLDVQNRVRLV